MLSIRFVRKGKKHHPIYRIIVQEKTKNPQSDYLENLGTYNPHTKEKQLKKDRIQHWLSKGAQPTETAHNLLVDEGIIKSDKVRAGTSKLGKKRKAEEGVKKAEEEAKKAEETTAPEEKDETSTEDSVEEAKAEEAPKEEENKEEAKEESTSAEAPADKKPAEKKE